MRLALSAVFGAGWGRCGPQAPGAARACVVRRIDRLVTGERVRLRTARPTGMRRLRSGNHGRRGLARRVKLALLPPAEYSGALPLATRLHCERYLCTSTFLSDEKTAIVGASCAVGPFSASQHWFRSAQDRSREVAGTVLKSHGPLPLLFRTVPTTSQLVCDTENGPTAHEAPIIVLFSSSAVFVGQKGKSRPSWLVLLSDVFVDYAPR